MVEENKRRRRRRENRNRSWVGDEMRGTEKGKKKRVMKGLKVGERRRNKRNECKEKKE